MNQQEIKSIKKQLGLEGLVLTCQLPVRDMAGSVAMPRFVKTRGIGHGIFGRFVAYFDENKCNIAYIHSAKEKYVAALAEIGDKIKYKVNPILVSYMGDYVPINSQRIVSHKGNYVS